VGDATRILPLALCAQVLVAARAGCAAAVRALIYRLVRGAPLCLHALAAQILVGAGEVFLAVTVEVLLLVAEAVGALLTIAVALGGINARFLACSGRNPLRQ
jgi:heme A synthase